MTRTFATTLLLLGASPGFAQPVFGPVCGGGLGGGFAYHRGFAFGGFYAAPIVPSYYGFFPIAGPGWGPGYGNPYFLPQPPLVAPSIVVVPRPIVIGGIDEPQEAEAAPLKPDRGVPLRPNDYIVISPRKDLAPAPANPPIADGAIAPRIDRVAPPVAPVRPPVFRFDPFAPRPVLGRSDSPEADPSAEANRQVKSAREAFGRQQYGRAAEHLDRAIRAKPDDPLPYFLKAQVRFASGHYTDAVAAIREGMKRAPNWPASDFRPVELYGSHPERFDAHIRDLRESVHANPDEPALRFLLAYQLWFSNQRDEAVRLLRSVAPLVIDGDEIQRFLDAARD